MKQRWTPQMDDVLRASRGRQSASQIGAALGLSRNAVLGRAQRLGLDRLRSTKPDEPAPSEARQEASNTEAHQQPRDAAARDAAPVIAPPVEIAGMKRLPLLELERKHCRWPAEGEGRHTLYCGLDARPGKPYCAGHCALAYRKPVTGNPNLGFIARRFGKSNLETLMSLDGDASDAPAASARPAWRAPAA